MNRFFRNGDLTDESLAIIGLAIVALILACL